MGAAYDLEQPCGRSSTPQPSSATHILAKIRPACFRGSSRRTGLLGQPLRNRQRQATRDFAEAAVPTPSGAEAAAPPTLTQSQTTATAASAESTTASIRYRLQSNEPCHALEANSPKRASLRE